MSSTLRIAVILPAAGASRRFDPEGLGRSKLDEDLGGRPVLQRTIELFNARDEVTAIIVAGPADDEAFAQFKHRHADKLALLGVTLCRGGRTHRYETVREALSLVPHDATHVAVHDAARPCSPMDLIDRVFDAASKYPAVIPALDSGDTLKRVSERQADDRDVDPLAGILGAPPANTRIRIVEATIDRTRLVAVQTPQVFRADLLRRAYTQPDLSSTDDAQLVERLGEEVTVVEGDARNLKITRPMDLRLARAILGVREPDGRATHKKF